MLSWIEFKCRAACNYLTKRRGERATRRRRGERERRTALIGYLAPLDVDWTMALHHYNLSSGSNLNSECPLPTALAALESAASRLESYCIYCCTCISKTSFFFPFAFTLRVADVFKRRRRKETCFITHAVCTQFSHIRRRSNMLIAARTAAICLSESHREVTLFFPHTASEGLR